MKTKVLLSMGALLILSGCTTIPYQCELGEECIGAKEAYGAAVENRGNSESVFGEPFDAEDGDAQRVLESEFRPYAGGGLTDKPLYQPPRPVRIWVAPWKGDDGMLRSGQFIYATRKGGWQMGELREQGVGGQLLHERTVLRPATPEPEKAPKRVQPAAQLGPKAEGK